MVGPSKKQANMGRSPVYDVNAQDAQKWKNRISIQSSSAQMICASKPPKAGAPLTDDLLHIRQMLNAKGERLYLANLIGFLLNLFLHFRLQKWNVSPS